MTRLLDRQNDRALEEVEISVDTGWNLKRSAVRKRKCEKRDYRGFYRKLRRADTLLNHSLIFFSEFTHSSIDVKMVNRSVPIDVPIILFIKR